MDMFTGWGNQVSSWMTKKGTSSAGQEPAAPAESVQSDASPEAEKTEGNQEAPESQQQSGKGMDLFSSVKNQMTNWLGPLSKKEKEAEDETKANELATPENEATEEEKGMDEKAEKEIPGTADEHSHIFEEVSTKALQGAKNFGSFFVSAVSKAGKTVTEAGAKIKKTVEENSLLAEFNKEQENFIKNKQKSGEAALPPWVGYPEEETLKEQILSLSTDRRNFLRSPPSGVQFHFDYDAMYAVAMATLAEDPNLEKMRFEIVPKLIKEELFWRNYFYRVSLIRQSTELSSMAQEGGNRDSMVHSRDSSDDDDDKTDDAEVDSPVHEFVSDAYDNQTLSKDLKEVQEGIKRLGNANKKRNEEDWERELQAELQDYELGSEGSGQTGGPDADDIEEMLDADDSPTGGDLK